MNTIAFGPGDPGGLLGFVGSAVVGIMIVAAWVILAGSRFVQGGIVERPERVPQLYGYTVCLVALVWAIMSTVSIVEASLTLADPLYRGGREYYGMEPSVSSIETFRTTYEMSRRYMSGGDPRDVKLDTLSEPELRRRFDALRADRIQRNTMEARRSLVTSIFSLLIAAALFAFHWRWLRRTGGAPVFGGTKRIDI